MRSAKSLVAVAAIAGLVAAGCGKSTPTTSGSSITPATSLTGAGSTFAQPLYNSWGVAYNQAQHVQVSYQGVGSSAGIGDLVNKQVDFGATDAPYQVTDTALPKIIDIPTALGAAVVTYNLKNFSGTLQLSGATLAGIFQGKVTTWNAPEIIADNPGATLPSTKITVVHRSDGSGTTYIFTSYLAKFSNWTLKSGTTVAWPTTTLGGKGSTGVEATVGQTDGAIGYVELSYAIQNHTPQVSVQNADKSAFVAPSITTTAAASTHVDASTLTGDDLTFSMVNEPGTDSYPIAGPTYMIVYEAQTNGPKGLALVNFMNWGLTTGQGAAYETANDYVALPSALATKAIAAVKKITYNGTPLLGQ